MVQFQSNEVFIKMSQKVNRNVLLLSNRLTWNSNWCETKLSYNKMLLSDFNERVNVIPLIKHFNLLSNCLLLNSSNGLVFTYSSLINWRYFTQSINLTEANLNTAKKDNNFLTPITPNNFKWSNISNERLKNIFLPLCFTKLINHQLVTVSVPFILSKSIADFIANQLLTNFNSKTNDFKKGLFQGIVSTVRSILNKSNYLYIKGISVKCKGKWSRTRSGRKQLLSFDIGQLNSDQKSLISFAINNFNTKFGSCSIKVWICYNYM